MLANAHNVTCSQALEVLGQIDCKAEASSAPAFSANQATAWTKRELLQCISVPLILNELPGGT